MSDQQIALSTLLQELLSQFIHRMNMDDEQCLQLIRQIDSILSTGQRHTQSSWAGHMTSAVNEIAALGQLLASLHQGNLLSPELYPELSMLERDVFAFFCPLFGQKTGHPTHGGSYSNLDALWQARKKYGDQSKRVYASDQSHYSIAKACDVLGLDLQLIPSNSLQQMDITALETACKQQAPMAIVATSGTTSSGQLDDVTAIRRISQKIPCWLHIDAAWGGFLSLIDNSPLNAEQFGQADSVCFDPHKSLGQPRPSGLLMYQDEIKKTPFSTQYLSQSPRDVLPGSYGAELLLPLWLTIKTLGKNGLANQVKSKLDEARQFASFINQQSGWWAQWSPTGIVCFTAPYFQLTDLLEKGVFSQTELNGKLVYRAVFASHTTSSEALTSELARFL